MVCRPSLFCYNRRVMHKVCVIGMGPGGIAASVMLKRYNLSFLAFEKDTPGGLIREAYRVENTLYFPNGISGKYLQHIFTKHLNRWSIAYHKEEVLSIKYNNNSYLIETDKGSYTCQYVIGATGTIPKTLPLNFKHVYYYPSLLPSGIDNLLIVGGGDIAFDYSLTAKNILGIKNVTILHRSKPKALPILVEEAIRSGVKTVKGSILDSNSSTLLTTAGTFSPDAILIAIGRIPNDKIYPKDTPNLYLIGDVASGIFRQTTIAISDGIKAVMDIAIKERR